MNDFGPRIPTLRSVDHFGFTVPNLEQAIDFFVTHFGGELIYRDGPFFDHDSDTMYRRVAVHPRAVSRLAVVRIGKHTNFEIFEYDAADQNRSAPRNSDIGGHHIGFYVDDIDTAWEYLGSVPGVERMEGPNDVKPDAPISGQRWFYFSTPWGMQLEFTSSTGPGFYEGQPGERMAPPSETWR